MESTNKHPQYLPDELKQSIPTDSKSENSTRQRANTSNFPPPGYPASGEDLYVQQSQVNLDQALAAQSDADRNSEDERVSSMLVMLEHVFDKPVIHGKCQDIRQTSGSNSPYLSQFSTASLRYVKNDLNQSVITNPRAILEVFKPDVFLRSGLTEESQCRLIDRLMDIINGCPENNCDVLCNLPFQPIEFLNCPERAFEKRDLKQSDLVQQFIAQNNLGLYRE
jgi:hypothetical protein